MRPKHFLDECNDGTVGHVGILSTLQYAGIASLETEREDIETDIGTCLVHHSNDTIRHTLLAQKQSVGQRLLVEHFAKRIVQMRHIAQRYSNVVQSLGRELQTVVQRIVLRHTTKVVGIGSKQLLYMRLGSVGKVQQHGGAVGLGKTRQCIGGGASGMECIYHIAKSPTPDPAGKEEGKAPPLTPPPQGGEWYAGLLYLIV